MEVDPATEVSIGPGPDIADLTITTTNPHFQDGGGIELIDNVRFGHQTVTTPPTASPTTATTQPAVPPVTPPAPAPDSSAPNTRLKLKPSSSLKRVVRVTAISTEAGSTFQCKLDRHKRFTSCKSTQKLRVRPGRHTLRLRAIDAAGNVDPTPAKASWVTK